MWLFEAHSYYNTFLDELGASILDIRCYLGSNR